MFEKYTQTSNMFDTLIHLREGGGAEAVPRSGRTDPGLWTVAALHATDDKALHSHVWERHPAGNEVLCALSGSMHVYLRNHGDGSEPVATLTPGQCFIVPAGRWHRLTVSEPGQLLAITPRADTEHEKIDQTADGGRQ